MKKLPRRDFLKRAAIAASAVSQSGYWSADAKGIQDKFRAVPHPLKAAEGVDISYPRVFRGAKLKMISFPLGGVGAGSLGLGGRGQLRDWEIFNRPNRGFAPSYAFPAIWVQTGETNPVARVLEARILPPFEGPDGLGSRNAPGLSRLQSATFIGEYPLAHIDFTDPDLPVRVCLDAFSPFIPHVPDDSGLPVAILRYRVTNPETIAAKVGIVFSLDNPISSNASDNSQTDTRVNERRVEGPLSGLLMSNSGLAADDPMHGTLALAALAESGTQTSCWRGWPKGPWWNSPLLFWDAFSADGHLNTEPDQYNQVGALCQNRLIPAGKSADFTLILAWHFPNRTPDWCGWASPPGKGKSILGNFYCTRFKDAWEAAKYVADNLNGLENSTRKFAETLRESTLPAVLKEAASANLSTLASTTCFRTADGEFHGFEGSDNALGSCYGNCTHVWNYETATAFLFPSFALSLRRAAFGYSLDNAGALHARQLLPDGEKRDSIIAADGHMGQIMHAYLDWKLSGDKVWLQSMWPRIKLAIAFAWTPGGWDSTKSGVLDGVQNNTYDVAFFGPNPLCGIYFLGALRAAEEMALALGDIDIAEDYRRVFEQGSRWIDANLFNGQFYVQQIKTFRPSQIAPSLMIGTKDINPENPEFQLGKGCLVDQLVGQYLAQVMNLGYLVSPQNVKTTLESIYKYNYKRTLVNHDNVERTFALNDESAMVICDYGPNARPRVPFPYFAEVMTGFEYSTIALMLYLGMVDQGVECTHNIRSRYDGEKRNPWDESEAGHHYARAMASWSGIVALSGFQYDGNLSSVIVMPRIPHNTFQCFWSTGTGWGRFSYQLLDGMATQFRLEVIVGTLRCASCGISAKGTGTSAKCNGRTLLHTTIQRADQLSFHFADTVVLHEGIALQLEVHP